MSRSFKPTRLLQLGAAAAALGAPVGHAAVVAHYPFDEAVGAASAANEIVANGGDGVIGANVITGVAGKVGNAVSLNNAAGQADIIDMGNATGIFNQLTASGQLTLSYWLSSTDTSGGRNVAVFMGNDAATNAYVDSGILGGGGANNGAAQGRNRDATNTASQIGELFGPPVNDGVFHHVALAVDTAGARGFLYVDGVLVSSGSGAGYDSFPVFNNFEVGRLGRSAPTDAFEGLIDDLQVYDAALNAREIAALFNNPGLTLDDLPPIIDGDTNGDGLVNVADFSNIRNSLGYSGLAPGLAVDVAGNDGVIDFLDLRFFQSNFPHLALAAAAVPEPATLWLGALALAALAAGPRRSR